VKLNFNYGLLDVISKYIMTVRILAIDSFLRYKKQSIIILLTGFLGVSFQAGAVAQAYGYIRMIERDESISLLGYTFQPRESFELFIFFVVAVMLSLLISSYLIYYSNVQGLNLQKEYEKYCSKRIIKSLYSFEFIISMHGYNLTDLSTTMKYVKGYSRLVGRVFRLSINMVIPLITFFVALGALIVINYSLTLLLIIPGLIYMVVVYRINLQGANASNNMEQSTKEAGTDLKAMVKAALFTPFDYNQAVEKVIDGSYRKGAVNKNISSYIERLMSVQKSEYAANILLAVSITLIMFMLIANSFFYGGNWSEILIYIVALRYMLNNLRGVSKSITSINRYYPQFCRYFSLISVGDEGFEKLHQISISNIKNDKNNTDQHDMNSIPTFLKTGFRISLLGLIKLDKFSLIPFFALLLDNNRLRDFFKSAWFVQLSAFEPLPVPFSYYAGYGLKEEKELRDVMIRAGLYEKYEAQFPVKSLKRKLPIDGWMAMDKDLKAFLLLLGGIKTKAKYLIIDEGILKTLSNEACSCFYDLTKDRVVFISYKDTLNDVGSYEEQIVLINDNNEGVKYGNMEWFEQNREEIEKILAPLKKDKGLYGFDNYDEEDEDDSDDI